MPANVVKVDLSQTSKSLAVTGGFIVIYGLISYVLKERLYLSEPLLAVTLGILVGPYVLNWVDPLSWGTEENTNELTYQFTRIIIGIQVLFCGISLPKAYLWKEKLSLFVLLFAVMTTAWLVTALLVWGLIPDLTFLESLCIASSLAPTDPVLANSITNGRFAEKYVPTNVRNILVAESGANDGLGFPFLYLAIYLLARNGEDANTSVATEVGRWVYAVVIYQILLSICFGALLGYVARKTLRWAEARSYIDKANFFAYGLGLAFFTLGTTGLFGSDDILACFIAGNSFTWDDWFRLRTEDNDFQEIIDSVLNLAVFLYVGAIIPWADFSDAALGLTGWRMVVLGLTILILRRPPGVIATTKLIPALRDYKESAFAGFFGPIGISAIFYIQVALRELPDDGTRDRLRRLYTPVVFFCVFSSVLVHGVTIPVSKLGPGVMKRTATLTQTKTITFSSKPGSRTTTIAPGEREPNRPGSASAEEVQARAETEKELWNPFYALWDGVKHVGLFWRRDSFWRKDPPVDTTTTTTTTKAKEREEQGGGSGDGAGQGEGSSDASAPPSDGEGGASSSSSNGGDAAARRRTEADDGKHKHLPPPSLELPTTNAPSTSSVPAPVVGTSSPTAPAATAAAAAAPAAPPPARVKTSQHIGSGLLRALSRELAEERAEASTEAENGYERSQIKERKRIEVLRALNAQRLAERKG
ncbi:uncharacterized protein PFL1_05770 [Pseudozyma flocculosa PF-1]|uniref:Related to Na+/H+-exchanging protein n=2 Tax=Pseudozyma flocculosa TaxID=84751 RepID=A0A5C3F8W1_9BASI|nr:uncharacterized protein PFL1_05770 [Pseudozyma flocculosa PF-1]EPQ26792.1 hypothetical protein PFL1_05770 [Pseudozyma flocculosa PF-1]SPO40878.1 related to Na+/H+-exchanging protein [Pseudozyma flocculosa]